MKVDELKQKIEQGDDMLILDVREKEEFDAEQDPIPGAQNVPMGKIFVEAAQGTLPKDKEIVTVCASGSRCQIVARELKEKGYHIEELEGGMKEWR
ncbi:rhodanese-like domain-containing protein [Candidatus Kaiserbacteria bacterium]|nr:rhodanese-like domain-containing protein [Candidatus Kaiserbacteria bacterium]